jgi:hypothetical protein
MSAIEYQKLFLRSDGTVAIKCPACMFEKVAPYEKLPPKFMVQVRCKCGALFDVQYELRKKYRKNVDLEGIILKVVQDERWRKTLNESLN